jgi:hypothetical protein
MGASVCQGVGGFWVNIPIIVSMHSRLLSANLGLLRQIYLLKYRSALWVEQATPYTVLCLQLEMLRRIDLNQLFTIVLTLEIDCNSLQELFEGTWRYITATR